MAVQKPLIPKGTRDFSPQEMVKRNYIFDTIRKVFQRYGFLPIETPAMENLETLTGKYGEEGDQLIFKILNSRIHEAKDKYQISKDFSTSLERNFNSPHVTEKALRYDLTVPFARYVVMHQHELVFPFKRYQIQPVWRADKPQKGRYREFYQCDADVVGSDSLVNEVELIQLFDEVFHLLGLEVLIKINNRKISSGIAEVIGEGERIVDITVAMDKLDKKSLEQVNEEMLSKGVSARAVEQLQPIIKSAGLPREGQLKSLKQLLANSEKGKKGMQELEYVFSAIDHLGLKKSGMVFDVTLARGLNYYTGAIFEVKANSGTLSSSLCGGGRYDDLTGIFGLPRMSGVGISFGADRIYDVLTELNLFPETSKTATRFLFVNFGPKEEQYCLKLLQKIRAVGINAEIYPDHAKLKKQLEYAHKKGIPYVAIIGSEEIENNIITLKNMSTGGQFKFSLQELLDELK